MPTPPSDHRDLPTLRQAALPDLLLVNPAAGGGLGRRVLPALARFTSTHNWPVELVLTESPAAFRQKAQEAACDGRERIFAVGGDGTFQLLLNALQKCPQTILGIIPAGGGNDLAAALGLPNDAVCAATLLLNGEVCPLDAVRVRTAEGNEWLYAGGGGVGLDAEASRYASGAYRNLHGRLRYLLSAIRALTAFRAFGATVTTGDGESLFHLQQALVACVLNTPSYGAGLALAPDAKIDDGKLELVLLEDLSVWEIFDLLPSLALRGKLTSARVKRRSVACVRIQTDPPRDFHGDGEILGTTPVEISVVPSACRVLRARQSNSSSYQA